MKKYLWGVALTLVISSISAGNLAADPSLTQQDQAFLNSLAQQVAPASPDLTPPKPLPAGSCINLHCGQDSDCWPHCGGEGNSYCSNTFIRKCVPY